MADLMTLDHAIDGDGDPGLAAYMLTTRRWSDTGNVSAGTTSNLGASGGVIAWSLVGEGLANFSGDPEFFVGQTVSLSSFLSFDYLATLRAAFDAWSAVANIEFIQVADGGGDLGGGTFPTIRIGAGYVDGPYNVLASAWYPSSNARAGDIAFDSGETRFWTPATFFLTATHEIGHTIGLDHSSASSAIMTPTINTAISGLQDDDIAGARALYGPQDFGPNVYYMPSGRADLTLLDGAPSLTVVGNGLANAITGAAGAETLLGAGGGDTLHGGAGDDTLDGGVGADLLYGDAGADTFLFSSLTNGSDRILDLEPADRIALKGSAFGLSAGSLAAAGVDLVFGQTAHAAAPTLLFDAASGALSFDPDGTGAVSAVELARIAYASGLGGPIGAVSATQLYEVSGDFDRNGVSDVLWRDQATGSVGAWLMGVSGVLSWSPMGTVAAGWDAVAGGDFDGNGTADVLWRNAGTSAAGAWLMNNGRPGDWLALPGISSDWQVEGVGDFDHNGVDDVLMTNTVAHTAGAWLMSRGQPGGWLALGALGDWTIEGVGDFNADGTDDVLFFNAATRAVAAWKIRDGQPVDWWPLATLPSGRSIAEVADVNGDGTSDIVLREGATGEAGYWRVGNGVVRGLEALPAFDGAWSLIGSGALNASSGDDLLWRNAADGSVALNALGLSATQFAIV